MLTAIPVPYVTRLQQAAAAYQQAHAANYYADLLRAHAAAGLLRQLSIPAASSNGADGGSSSSSGVDHTAWGFASICPYKDMEVTVLGSHMACPAFQRMLHASLRAVIDGCGCRTFNVGMLNIHLAAQPPAGVGQERQFWSSGSGSADDAAGNGGGSTSGSSMSLSSMSTSSASSSRYQYHSGSSTIVVPDAWPWGDRPPVVARLVSRGKLTSVASDFGCLEVFGGASIGHTDPFLVVQALDEQLLPGAAHGQ